MAIRYWFCSLSVKLPGCCWYRCAQREWEIWISRCRGWLVWWWRSGFFFLTPRQTAAATTPTGTLIYPMTCGIRIAQRIVIDESILVPRLDALALHRHDGIRLRPASQRAVVPAGVEEVQADASFFDLTRESPVGGDAGQGVSRFSPRPCISVRSAYPRPAGRR